MEESKFKARYNIILLTKNQQAKKSINTACRRLDYCNVIKCHSLEIFKTLIPALHIDLAIADAHYANTSMIDFLTEMYHENQIKNGMLIDYNLETECEIFLLKTPITAYIRAPYNQEITYLKLQKLLDIKKDIVKVGSSIKIYPTDMAIDFYGKKILFTKTEFEILQYIIQSQGCQTTSQISNYLSNTYNHDINSTSLRVYIKRIRDKIESITGMTIIRNRHGLGYYVNKA